MGFSVDVQNGKITKTIISPASHCICVTNGRNFGIELAKAPNGSVIVLDEKTWLHIIELRRE